MALTYSVKRQDIAGNQRVNLVDITLDTSYSTGGYSLSAASLALSAVNAVQILGAPLPMKWIRSSNKLQVFSAQDQHTHGLLVTGGQAAGTALQYTPDSASGVLGKTTATNFTIAGGTSNIQNNTAGGLSGNTGASEIAASTDLSGITISVLAYGV